MNVSVVAFEKSNCSPKIVMMLNTSRTIFLRYSANSRVFSTILSCFLTFPQKTFLIFQDFPQVFDNKENIAEESGGGLAKRKRQFRIAGWKNGALQYLFHAMKKTFKKIM